MQTLGFSWSRFLFLFCLTLCVHVISYTVAGFAFSFIFFLTGIILLFFYPLQGVSFYFLSILLFDDINKYDVDLPPLESIFTINVMGQSISMLWSIIIFLVTIVALLNKRPHWKVAMPILVLLIFFFMGSLRIYQYKNPRFISDIAFIINILLGYAIGEVLLKSDDRIRHYFSMVIMVFSAKYIIITLYGIYSSLNGILYTFKGESASNYIILPLLLMLLILFNKKIKFSKTERIAAIMLLVFITSYLLITISRERLLFVALALLGYLIIYKKAQIIFYVGIISFVSIIIIAEHNPFMYDFIRWKATTLLPTSESGVNTSSSARVIEFQNIWHEQLTSGYKLFVGTGWGGYFTADHVPFTTKIVTQNSSFPSEWIRENKYFVPHGTYLYILLKYGLLGFVLFYGSLMMYAYRGIFDRSLYMYQPREIERNIWGLRYMQIALCIALPIGCLIIFTSKLQILSGFFLAMIYCIKKIIEARLKETPLNGLG